jgi:phosphoserine phosphatase
MELIIFDLDDTLVSSEAKIIVHDIKTGKEVETLTPEEFNTYTKNPKHFFNFSEFQDFEILSRAKLNPEVFEDFKQFLSKGHHVSILTARNTQNLVVNFLKQLKLAKFMNHDLIFMVGGEGGEYIGTIPERKSQVMKKLINRGYTKFTVYDDNDANLRAIKGFESPVIQIKTIFIVDGKKKEW